VPATLDGPHLTPAAVASSIPLAKVAFMPGGSIDWITVVLGLAAFAVLTFWKWRLNVVVVVLAGGALGILRAFAPGLFGGPLS
jgi:chromate transporter